MRQVQKWIVSQPTLSNTKSSIHTNTTRGVNAHVPVILLRHAGPHLVLALMHDPVPRDVRFADPLVPGEEGEEYDEEEREKEGGEERGEEEEERRRKKETTRPCIRT